MSINETAHIVGRYNIPTSVMQKINTFLPEGKIINPTYLVEIYDPNLYIEEASEVEVTFVHEGAAYKNTLGYFTYDLDSQGKIHIISRGLVFPNASYDPQAEGAKSAASAALKEGGGKLFQGDYTYLMDAAGRKITFSAGTNIGFFLVPDGWTGVTVDKWDENNPNLPFDNPEENSSIRDKGVITSIDCLNPETVRDDGKYEQDSHHFVIFGIRNNNKDFLNGENFLVLCVEDIIRPQGDQDFNDCIFIVRAKGIDICKYPESGCQEGDCTYQSIPEKTDGLICYDDVYQFPGVYEESRDIDMNDFVSYYRFTELNCQGDIKKIMGTFHFIHRGAWYDHDFGVYIPFISSLRGRVKVEYFLSDGNHETFQYSLSEVHNNRLTIFQSTKRYLPPAGEEGFTNTRPQDPSVNPCSARFVIEFASPVKRSDIGMMSMPYDPYLLVYTNGTSNGVNWNYDLHLNGMNRFLDAPFGLPEEVGENSFRRASDEMPYCFITNKSFQIVLERENIAEAYPQFKTWQPPFAPDTAEEVWMHDKEISKLLPKITKPERSWTISI